MKLNRDAFLDYILDTSIPLENRISSILESTGEGKHYAAKPPDDRMKIKEIGVVGNVWVRLQQYTDVNDVNYGHKHNHDHVSLLASGKALVKIKETGESTIFEAPTFFMVKAEREHTIVPLEPNTSIYCVFALRDENGEVTDFYDGRNEPYATKT